jgi:beta-xylosidase
MSIKELRRAFDLAVRYANQRELIAGRMGRINADGSVTFEVPGRPGYVYVRLSGLDASQTVAMAINHAVGHIPDLPVWLKRNPEGALEVVGVRAVEFLATAAPTGRTGAVVPPHTHEPGSGLTDPVSERRIRPGLVRAYLNNGTYGLSVYVEPFTYRYRGVDRRWPGGTYNLAPHLPASGTWRWVKVCLNPATNTLTAIAGQAISVTLELTEAMLDSITAPDYIPLAGVKLRGDDTAIADESAFLSCRPWWSIDAGAGGWAIWDVDATPASPGALDDEFSDGSIGALWTEHDPYSKQSGNEAGGELALSQNTQTSGYLTGYYQTLPGGDFTIVAKVKLNVDGDDVGTGACAQAGLALWEDASANNKRALLAGLYVADGVATVGWSVWSGSNAVELGYVVSEPIEVSAGTYLYLRLRRSGSAYTFDYSTDGQQWTSYTLTGYVEFTPGHVGVGIQNNSTGTTVTGSFSFFRYRAVADDASDPVYGALALPVSFLQLSDTPATYAGQAGKVPVVKATEDGLEFLSGFRDATKIQGRDVASTAPSDGQALVWSGANSRWQPGTVSGGGGSLSTFNIWMPDAPPESPSSYDDEFDGDTLASRWTATGSGSYELANGQLKLYDKVVYTSSIPSGDFTVWAKVFLSGESYNYARGLLQIRSSVDNSSGVAYYISIGYDSSNRFLIEVQRQNNGAFSFNPVQLTGNYGPTCLYLRIRYVSSVVYLEYSTDGLAWHHVYSANDVSPASVALGCTGNTSYMPTVYVEFIRFSTTLTSRDVKLPGRNVAVMVV